ncbi:ABC transporter permease [Knoellia sp. 3-2P3]|uniref:FtsX-like permease family protein n=1 Tax=unclassified Knoellia TaxID=2618719 RepID=UPI0023DBA01A|nr:ABC transporter permease [Knoellia sp. 3-2P3]MDF2091439.1 ABC transporter permease [Knoellia sp. 3-2P3]
MTTLAPGQPAAPDLPETSPQPERPHRATRLQRWRASWRVALRMARRDVRRHRGRSILVLVMVSLPVALLVAAACWADTGTLSGADRIPLMMGSGQALVQSPQEQRIAQFPEPDSYSSDGTPAKAVPGFVAGADNTAAMERLLGGELVPVTETDARFLSGDRRIRIHGLVVDGRRDIGPKAELTSGRWPTDNTEVVVTPAGVDKGLPTSGPARFSVAGEPRDVEVVGTATALSAWGGQPDFVVPTVFDIADMYGATWILQRERRVPWSEVRSLNEYGIVVTSAAALENPPADHELDPSIRGQAGYEADRAATTALVGGVMLFIVTTLLVGPAFAVSAARQRRTLAIAASNGAETRQLRRSVLAQALVLGAAAAVGGAFVGALGLRAAVAVWRATHPGTLIGSFSLPWVALAIIVPCAVVSAVTAALIPSLRLGRLDIVGVMRGQSVSPPANRVLPVVGALMVVGGGLFLVASVKNGAREVAMAGGAVVLVLGALLTVPALLVVAGALASRLPVAPRMATRDAARHRTRSTPTVAAILAGVAALTAFSIGVASDTEQRQREYRPQAAMGQGFVQVGEPDARISVTQALRSDAPEVVATPYALVSVPETTPASTHLSLVAVVPPGCTPKQALGVGVQDDPGSTVVQRCMKVGTLAYNQGQVMVLPASELGARLGLTPDQQQMMAEGGLAAAHPGLARNGAAEVVFGAAGIDQQTGGLTDLSGLQTRRMPVVELPQEAIADGRLGFGTGAAVTTETAERLGWPTTQQGWLLRDPEGAISAETQKRLDESIADEGWLYVERGFQRDDIAVLRVMFGLAAALLLAVTLISTALSLAEQQADMGTFAAVGATRRTRRALAGSQAMVVGLIGAVLGVVVGLFPGVAITHPLTATSWDDVTGQEVQADPTLVIPWLPLLLVVVGVPLLAGLLSAAAIRAAPAVARRAE